MSRDLARERLKEIRSLQGWREAYKVAGLTPEGSDATKRRRLSRVINPKTSGARKLEPKQRQKVNRAYRYRKKKGTFSKLRSEKAVKAINKAKREQRKRANKVFGAGGISPDKEKLDRRKRQNADLTDEEVNSMEEAFRRAEEDGGVSLRAEYAKHMSTVNITDLPMNQRTDFEQRQRKAVLAEERDRARAE